MPSETSTAAATGPRRFRKKPIEIEAVQWDGTTEAATAIIEWVLAGGGTSRFIEWSWDDSRHRIHIDTLEGVMRADPHDWIIRGVAGEFYPCKPDIFTASYEETAS